MAVHVPITELLMRMARELVQAGPAASRAAVLWAAAGDVHKDMVMVTSARSTARGSKAQVLAVAVVFCARVGSCGDRELLKTIFFCFVCLLEPFSCLPVWLDLLNAFKATTCVSTSNHSFFSPFSSWYQSMVLSDGKIR